VTPELIAALVLFLNGVTAYFAILAKDATSKNRRSIQRVSAQIEDKSLFICSKCGAAESPSGFLRIEHPKNVKEED
jgi:hypothetical protein